MNNNKLNKESKMRFKSMAVFVFVWCMLVSSIAWGAYEKSGLIYYPSPDTDFSSMVAAIESRGLPAQMKFLYKSGETTGYLLSSDTTFPEFLTLDFEPGAGLVYDGYTITIDGIILDTMDQIFYSVSGGTIQGDPQVDWIRPEWWGAESFVSESDATTANSDSQPALQAAFDLAAARPDQQRWEGVMLQAGVYRTLSAISSGPVASGPGFALLRIEANAICMIYYDGPEDDSVAVLHGYAQINGCEWTNIIFNANYKAGYGVWFQATVDNPSHAFNTFNKCSFWRANVAGFAIAGLPSEWGKNEVPIQTDAGGNMFKNCRWWGNVEGFVASSNQYYWNSFDTCYFGRNTSIDNQRLHHNFRQSYGSGSNLIDCSFGPLYGNFADKSNILVEAGSMNIFGGYSEDGHFLRAEAGPASRIWNNITIDSFIINANQARESGVSTDDTYYWSTDEDWSIWADYGSITINNSTLHTANSGPGAARWIHAEGSAIIDINKTTIGPSGNIDLITPEAGSINGYKLGREEALNANPVMDLWTGSAADEVPFGYKELKLGGGITEGTITRSTDHAKYGQYTALIEATTTPVSAYSMTPNLIDVTPYRGKYLNVVVTGTMGGGSTLSQVRLNASTTTQSVPLGNRFVSGTSDFVSRQEILIADTDTWFGIDVGVTVSGASMYVDSIMFFPGNFIQLPTVEAIGKYGAESNPYEEYLKAGVLSLGYDDSTEFGNPLVRILSDSAAPTTGTWKIGDIVLNSAPASAGKIGWVCTVAGSPGTWETWGAID